MTQKDLDEEVKKIKSKAFELYEKHGFHDGNDFVDWLEAERLTAELDSEPQAGKMEEKRESGRRSRSKRNMQLRNILLAIVGILCIIVVILLVTLFRKNARADLSEKTLSQLKVMMMVLDPKVDEKLIVFGDTHFDFDQFTLSGDAKSLLDADVQVLKENPDISVRMAGYSSARGSEQINQKISEKRANAVRDYLIEKGIEPSRITTIGYGRTKPAVFEVSPGDTRSKEALANMRVLFEIVVK
jgi:outer membrane protein OmpA-like peptidoglycan-associated protein